MKAYREPYDRYKSTHLPWLEEIPTHWSTIRVKFSTYVKARIGWQGLTVAERIDEGPYLVTGTDFRDGEIDWATCAHVTEERYEQDPYIQLQEGDLLITKDGTIGKVAIVRSLPARATLNSGVFVTRPLGSIYSTDFMYWVLSSAVFEGYIDYTKTGSTISHLYQKTFHEFSFPVPTLAEQQAIASFLDNEVTAVDTLIAKKRLLIERLQEKRAALISQAVTKGLDTNVPVMDSGIEWLGEIPAHWEVLKVKWVASKIGSGKTPRGGADVYSESGIVFLRSQNILNEGIQLVDTVYIDPSIDEAMASTRVQPLDILLNITGASIGRSSLVPMDFPPSNVNQHVCIIRPHIEEITPRFLHSIMISDVVQAQIIAAQVGASREGLSFAEIGNLYFAAPRETDEQEMIAEYIDTQTNQLDQLQAKIATAIEQMAEYRTALICAAVTGKIDLRPNVQGRS